MHRSEIKKLKEHFSNFISSLEAEKAIHHFAKVSDSSK
jgi:hypothetical protein